MRKPYLIQRARFDKNPSDRQKGIDRLLDWDYMGSSEFECGALPASSKRVKADVDKYKMYDYTFKKHPTKSVTVYCKPADENQINGFLEELSENKIRLMERCDLPAYFKDDDGYRHNDFWWDIENDWMFWKQNEDFSIKFQGALMENNAAKK